MRLEGGTFKHMRNVLVTGAAGFLGSHLVKHHLDAGDRVLGIDDFCSSDPKSAHLAALKTNERFTFYDGDITKPTLSNISIDRYIKINGKLDIVYNFACPASPPRYQDMPLHTMLTCVLGTDLMLDVAGRNEAVFVQASTSEVYGDPNVSPQPESYRGYVNSYGPRSCYDEGKRAAEALCYDHRNTYGVDARLVRIFNTYGPNMDPYDGRVVSNFIRQALKGEPLTIYGHGQQTRSFCYVDDLIRGIVAMAELPTNPGTPINLGNPIEFTIHELASRIALTLNGGKLVEKHDAMPVDDPSRRCPDITFARDLLGWEPKVGLHEGLEKTIAYFKNYIQ